MVPGEIDVSELLIKTCGLACWRGKISLCLTPKINGKMFVSRPANSEALSVEAVCPFGLGWSSFSCLSWGRWFCRVLLP